MNTTKSKRKIKPKPTLPDGFTGFVNSALVNLGDKEIAPLSDGALVTLLIIRAHCVNGNPCTASYATIASIRGKSRSAIKCHFEELLKLELITTTNRIHENGDPDSNETRLTSAGNAWFVDAVGSETNRGRVKNEPRVGLNSDGGGRVKNSPQRIVKREEEKIEEEVRSSSASTPKQNRRGEPPEHVVNAIDSLDLKTASEKYPSLDVTKSHRRFRNYYLNRNDARTGKPNWIKVRDWEDAFDSWLENDRERQADKTTSNSQASQPHSKRKIPTDLSKVSIDYVEEPSRC